MSDKVQIKAVIDLGSVSVRMEVVQINSKGQINPLDSLSQSVQLGRDTFTGGRIKRNSIEQCVRAFRSFTTVLNEYGIDFEKDVTAVATSAVREARNCDTFLERIYVATGIWVQAIDGATVNRLTFLGVWPLIKSRPKLLQKRISILEIGGGSTDLLGLNNGEVRFSHSYRFGSYRFREMVAEMNLSKQAEFEMAENEINSLLRSIDSDLGDICKQRLILMGGAVRFAAKRLRASWDGKSLLTANISSLSKMATEFFPMNAEHIAGKYNMPLEEAQILGFALLAYTRIAEHLSLKQIFLCDVSLRSGLLAETGSPVKWRSEFDNQVVSSARQMAERYNSDMKHALCVEMIAMRIYAEMQAEHKLPDRYILLLRTACILHDCGRFISLSGHHKHSKYLIENSDLFGLNREDIKVVAMIARYHRRAEPKTAHSDYNALSRSDKLVINKLAAILRVADALDNLHTQNAEDCEIQRTESELRFLFRNTSDLNTTRLALFEKARLFEQIFGLTVIPAKITTGR
jgi:exopolyphosphatase/guanosine-5'-triphosphate,3'-diphosphate pyrophosphatase